ncbi:hypothetical protein [Acaryochloris marina]|uniref:Uncharacterized protein n=1 Tax=Acaryochloris marina (strain MBIC 11017) TaxID=329726 RepID=B0C123_ACAM1|nr:hypothetical protein [Acaryochloris marina]ABW27282.1 hypothetical protein AM1_2271 [Acaryochloris marina MBIC11017]
MFTHQHKAIFPFVDTRTLRTHFQLGKFCESRLREQLPSPIYWIQPERKVLWNIRLVQDYLLNGDGPSHQRLVEEYLSTLEPQIDNFSNQYAA